MFHLLQTVKREITELFLNCLELTQPTLAMRNIAIDIRHERPIILESELFKMAVIFQGTYNNLKTSP